jgi:hypothetical protein
LKIDPETKKTSPKIKSSPKKSSPENKPLNGQQQKESSPKVIKKEDDTKTLKIQNTVGEKGSDYNPAKKNYHPIEDAFWERGKKYGEQHRFINVT